MRTDILIIGCGCSGLYCALKLPRDKQITIITKSDAECSDSYLAQGGMCMLRDESDYEAYFTDTLRAGHEENDRESVAIMIRSSQGVVKDLLDCGVRFAREEDGTLAFTREAAHSAKRIIFHKDITGQEITSHLLARVRERPNVTLLEYTTMLDLIADDANGICYGAIVRRENGEPETIEADYTVLATGGIGGLYRHSTNRRNLYGDGLAAALRHGIALRDADYIQIHPTTFYSTDTHNRSFLISESVRGEGALLYNKKGERFVDELLPRDQLAKAIFAQMEQDGTDYVMEDLRPIPREELNGHFPNIVARCKEMGYDVFTQPIPVVPAQHYYMGGIRVDHQSRTSMRRLYAIGETACNGVHGKNRLASNSLLESMVFAKRAADEIAIHFPSSMRSASVVNALSLAPYRDAERFEAESRALVLDEIRRWRSKAGAEAAGRPDAHVAFKDS